MSDTCRVMNADDGCDPSIDRARDRGTDGASRGVVSEVMYVRQA